MTDFEHITRCVIASGISTATIGFGLFSKRKDESRRWVFVVAGIICAIVTTFALEIGSSYATDRAQEHAIIFQFASVGVLGLAIGLLIFGWRGKRVGDHPFCRKCGFDLFGKPPESTRCSECGVELVGKAAPVIGEKRVRRRIVLTGIFLLLLVGMVSGPTVYSQLTAVDWNQYKPMSWLISDINSPNGAAASQAIAVRLTDKNLSARDARTFADYVLKDLEAGRMNPMTMELLKLVDDRDLLDEPRVRRLMKIVVNFKRAFMPTNVVRGRPYPVLFFHSSNRNLVLPGNIEWEFRVIEDRIDDIVIPPACFVRRLIPGEPSEGVQREFMELGKLWDKIPAGEFTHTRKLECVVRAKVGGKWIEEKMPTSLTATVTLLEPKDFVIPRIAPTPADEKAEWAYRISKGNGHQSLELIRKIAGSRILAHLWVVDATSRKELGVMDINGANTYPYWTLSPGQTLPAGEFTLELIPGTEADDIFGDMTPILNQTIRISKAKRDELELPVPGEPDEAPPATNPATEPAK